MNISTSTDSDDPILTTAAAARLLGVAVSTTQLWLESGALPSWKTPGGHRRVRMSAVLGLLAERAHQGSAQAAPGATPDPEYLPVSSPGFRQRPDEMARLAALRASGLVDTPAEPVFDRLAFLAAQVTDCQVGLVTLLTAHRQWFKAKSGTAMTETPREWAFCNHTIMQREGGSQAFVVDDAARDPRFAANPLVTGEPHIRFYAGLPLVDAAGHPLGALCVLDSEPRRLRARELKALEEVAAIAVEELRRRT
jgi:excisionase family DNA binding protein